MGRYRAVTAIAVNPIFSYHLAVATRDSIIRIYDQRMLGTRASGMIFNYYCLICFLGSSKVDMKGYVCI